MGEMIVAARTFHPLTGMRKFNIMINEEQPDWAWVQNIALRHLAPVEIGKVEWVCALTLGETT
jgi:hypothetical protein